MLDFMKTNDILTDFLLSKITAHVLSAYKLMASLNYPIPDKYSFVQQLDQVQDPNEQSSGEIKASTMMLDNLKAVDFPMQTLRGGLEKLYDRIHEPLLSERETVARPDVVDLLNETFSTRPDCARRAIEYFSDCYGGPGSYWYCLGHAILEGNRCMDM
jgi:hypothetical protein